MPMISSTSLLLMLRCKCNVSSQRVGTQCLLTASASSTAARVVGEIQGKWIIGSSNATGNKPGSLGTGHYSSGEREHIQAANDLMRHDVWEKDLQSQMRPTGTTC